MKRTNSTSIVILSLVLVIMANSKAGAQAVKDPAVKIQKTEDFKLSGKGTAGNWSEANWIQLKSSNVQKETAEYSTKAKVLYSTSGIYFLFQCRDSLLNASMKSDYKHLWKEDVVEIFLKPNDDQPFYLEYELSPLNYELLLFISDRHGYKTRWQTFDYAIKKQTRHKTSVSGGQKKSGASITKWMAEFFIPYEFLQPIDNVPPKAGDRWRANLYRVDYDGEQTSFAWQPVDGSFHEYSDFGTFIFE